MGTSVSTVHRQAAEVLRRFAPPVCVVFERFELDFSARDIRVVRAFSAGRLETPTSGHGRTVDMSRELARVLGRLEIERKAETLRRGWRAVPPWVFCTDAGTPFDANNIAKAFKRVLKAAGLPLHFSPHGFGTRSPRSCSPPA